MSDWVRATGTDLPEGGSRLFCHLDKRIAVFRTSSGYKATDNRCPHEGYALVKGDVREDVLTCAWHNWKFELATGACLFGGENVRTYPVEVRNGDVWVDVEDPPAEQIAPQLFESLLEAMGEVDVGRIARDSMRLQRLGVPLAEIVREGVRWGAPKLEYGWNHSLATLAECLNLARTLQGPLSSLPVLQGLSVVSENEVRRPPRPRPDPVDPAKTYGTIDEALQSLPKLIDDERKEEAEALLRGLIMTKVDATRIRHALLESITDHFLGYGHPLIYAQKGFELLDTLGWGEADDVLGPLVPNIVLSTRYDKLPYMRNFLRAWRAAELDLDTLLSAPRTKPFDERDYIDKILDGSPEDAFGAVRQALKDGTPVPAVIDATTKAASERFSRFDIDLDTDDTNEWGWLDVTHTLTYTDALRWAWSVDPHPKILRGLFHAAWFVQWTERFDAKTHREPEPHATEDAADLLEAIRGKDPDAATALIAGYAGPQGELETAMAQAAAEDNSVAPIMVAHTVKTTRAAVTESQHLNDRAPLKAAARFLASPKRERFVYQATLEAMAFVQGRSKGEAEEAGAD